MPRQRGGRISLNDREVDDSLAARTSAIDPAHVESINVTQQEEVGLACRRNYRNRIKTYYNFTFNAYPEEYQSGTRLLTTEEKADTAAFHYKNLRDIIYTGFDVQVFKAFLTSIKVKRVDEETGEEVLMGYDDVRKYKDAILWGANRAKQFLPKSFYQEMDVYLKSYKKETARAKKDNRLDESDADPINGTLFRMMCEWAVDEGNIFVWAFSLCQWHLMARSCNVDQLALHNIKRQNDSIAIKYDSSKMDQTGEFTTEKNCYANPLKPLLCLYLALGVWLSLNATMFAKGEKLFQRPGSGVGAASQRYGRQLVEILLRHDKIVRKFIRLAHAAAHGIRKVRSLF